MTLASVGRKRRAQAPGQRPGRAGSLNLSVEGFRLQERRDTAAQRDPGSQQPCHLLPSSQSCGHGLPRSWSPQADKDTDVWTLPLPSWLAWSERGWWGHR